MKKVIVLLSDFYNDFLIKITSIKTFLKKLAPMGLKI